MKKMKRESWNTDGIEELRDQLKGHTRSFKADMKDEWRRIESDWRMLKRQLLPARRAAEKSASDVRAASELLSKSVKTGYERIKHSLQQS